MFKADEEGGKTNANVSDQGVEFAKDGARTPFLCNHFNV